MENVMKQFREIQMERFREWEEMRWQRECEIEEERRKEDRQHKRLMLQMILQITAWAVTTPHKPTPLLRIQPCLPTPNVPAV